MDDRRGRSELCLTQWVGLDDRLLFIGRDGLELEIIAIEQPDHLLILHVMPYAYRRRSR